MLKNNMWLFISAHIKRIVQNELEISKKVIKLELFSELTALFWFLTVTIYYYHHYYYHGICTIF